MVKIAGESRKGQPPTAPPPPARLGSQSPIILYGGGGKDATAVASSSNEVSRSVRKGEEKIARERNKIRSMHTSGIWMMMIRGG